MKFHPLHKILLFFLFFQVVLLQKPNGQINLSTALSSPKTPKTTTNNDYLITTIVGKPRSQGDGGLAIHANLFSPSSVILSSDNRELFIADSGSRRVKKVVDGVIVTVAGIDEVVLNVIQGCGFGGDGGLGKDATVCPNGLFLFEDDLFISEGTNRIRKLFKNGTIVTVAGNGERGYGGDGGLAINANLNSPSGLFVDKNGELFIADSWNSCIRKVSKNGIISTVAGNATSSEYSKDGELATLSKLDFPKGVFVSSNGEIYITETRRHRIRKVSNSGIISTIAGNGLGGLSGDGGLATNAKLLSPTSVFVNSNGEVYISDTDNHRIRKVSNSGIISTVAGNSSMEYVEDRFGRYGGYSGDGGLATYAELNYPRSTFLSSNGDLFIADSGNECIRKVSPNGVISTIAGTGPWGYKGDGIQASNVQLESPVSVFQLWSSGEIFVVDSENSRVINVSRNGLVSTVAGVGTWGRKGDDGLAIHAQLWYPSCVFVDLNGEVFIADVSNERVRKVSNNGIISRFAGTGEGGYNGDERVAKFSKLFQPSSVFVSPSGEVFIADTLNSRIRKVSTTGFMSTIAGNGTSGLDGDGGLAIYAQLNQPRGIFISSENEVFIADTGNHRIRKISKNGIISTIAGTDNSGFNIGDGEKATLAQLSFPVGVTVTSIGEIIIADRGNDRVRKVSTNGIISTIAGNGKTGKINDGGLGKHAQLTPAGVFASPNGDILIADVSNALIRKLIPICFDTPSNETGVCSGAGKCLSPNYCKCLDGHAGLTCETITCFGIEQNNPSICNGKGICSRPNYCQCANGYTGANCEMSICYNVAANETGVCSSFGVCIDKDRCQCREKYIGENCQYPVCFNKPSNKPSVCSGSGKCISPDYCECDLDYKGNECQTPVSVIIGASVGIGGFLLIIAPLILLVSALACAGYRHYYKKWNGFKNQQKELEKKLLSADFENNDMEMATPHKHSQNYNSFIIPIEELTNVIEKLGSGASGTVYKIKWREQVVAAKLFDVGFEGTIEFEKEALILNNLKHPNIVTFYGVSISEHKCYIVMEYMEGSLNDLIGKLKTRQKTCSLSTKVHHLMDISNGMNYLHNIKPYPVIHRDLKPGNILIKHGTCKVCDFGLSRIVSQNTNSHLTTDIGSLHYMAPEMITGENDHFLHKDLVTAIDVYSFAIIMWELLFEENPYFYRNKEKFFTDIPYESSEYNKLSSTNILYKTAQGLRPILPFESLESCKLWCEKYMVNDSAHFEILFEITKLIQQCWHQQPQNRPKFSVLLDRFVELTKQFI